MKMPKNVTIIEVGPRDGLQNLKTFVPTEAKVEFIKELKKAGITEMELTSFVSPKWVPQMSDAAVIIDSCHDFKARDFVLVPNQKGMDRLKSTSCKNAAVFVGVSNTFNKKNINKSTEESMTELEPLIRELKEQGYFVRACISTSFYCPYEGKVAMEDVVSLCNRFVDFGVDELSVADTVGEANPKESYDLFTLLKEELEDVMITAHFHNTRGMALANIFAALQAGIDRFDTSAGGLGGCPFAPGASGNVATEDVVYMLEHMGIGTGVNLKLVVKALENLLPHLDKQYESQYYKLVQGSTVTEPSA
ncbi:hydroxymethylglutaryl-CoA lyase [Sutcliffiella rhizosphaerae]|uniref:Hydroxymethylglutaryl-CoA lyase YngG n=1 Tax=Sutcliffiella rhizosphaerae TaxID=2880967 RepID=A0ABM8YNW3_9BACI|nr:hydroxymethylglutaryl-CoA lyase [Sutcliffiella rhizosphaerae]CAG9621609.1 Hydroxymethylglutaryl-CoA lyase YngG [Sutcliffiella rhizosphaerae]